MCAPPHASQMPSCFAILSGLRPNGRLDDVFTIATIRPARLRCLFFQLIPPHYTTSVILVNVKIQLDPIDMLPTIRAMKEIGDRVKSMRAQRGLTQESLADKCGMHQSAIAHLENGRRTPSAPILVRLCRALECRSDYLLGLCCFPGSSRSHAGTQAN